MASRIAPFGEGEMERSENANTGDGEREGKGLSPLHIHTPTAHPDHRPPEISTDSAFDRLLSAALSTVIAILLAWRFLIIDDEKNMRSRSLLNSSSDARAQEKTPADSNEGHGKEGIEVAEKSGEKGWGGEDEKGFAPEPGPWKGNPNHCPTSCRSSPLFPSPIQRNIPSNFCNLGDAEGDEEWKEEDGKERMKSAHRPSAGTTRGNPNNSGQPWDGKIEILAGDHTLPSPHSTPQQSFSSLRRPLIAPPDKEEPQFFTHRPDSRPRNFEPEPQFPHNPHRGPDSSLSSLKLLLPCGDEEIPGFREEMDSPEIATPRHQDLRPESRNAVYATEEDALMVDHFDSDVSSEHGALPAYLDTITEEDTDDLTSQSSGRFSPFKIRAEANVFSPMGGSVFTSQQIDDSSDTDSVGFNRFESTDTIVYLEEDDDLGNEAGDESSSEEGSAVYRVSKHQAPFPDSPSPHSLSGDNSPSLYTHGISSRGTASQKAPLVVLTEIDTLDTFSTPSSPLPGFPESNASKNMASSSFTDGRAASSEDYSEEEWEVRSTELPPSQHISPRHGETGEIQGHGGEIRDASRHLPTFPTSSPIPPRSLHSSSLPLTHSHCPQRTTRPDFSLSFVTQVEEQDEVSLDSCQEGSIQDSSSFPSRSCAASERRCTTAYSSPVSDESEGSGRNSIRSKSSPIGCEGERVSLDSSPTREGAVDVNHAPLSVKLESFHTNSESTLLYHEFSDFPRPINGEKNAEMEIDLKRVMERFARYGAVYGDAPSSGMEEFNPKPRKRDSDSVSSRSSSIISIGGTFRPSDHNKEGPVPPAKKGEQTEDGASGVGSLSLAACLSDTILIQQPVCDGEFADPSSGTSPPRPSPFPPSTNPVLSEGDSFSAPPPLPTHSPPLSPAPQQSSLYKEDPRGHHEDHGLNASRVEDERDKKTSSTSDLNGTFSSEGEIIVASASSQLVRGAESSVVLSEASANAVSRNPYIALARATASAASKLSPDYPTSEGEGSSLDQSSEKLSIVVATTLTASKKELRSPKSRNFVGNATKLQSEVSSLHLGRSSEAQSVSPLPSASSSPVPTISSSVRDVHTHAQPHSNSLYPHVESPVMIPRPAADSLDKKRPLLQQQSQHCPRTTNSMPAPQIPPRHGNEELCSPPTSSPLSPTPDPSNSWQYSATENAIMDDGTPKLSRAHMSFSPEPQRIIPPSPWIEEEPTTRTINPRLISTENIEKMLEKPKFKATTEPPTKGTAPGDPGSLALSSEHLHKLLHGAPPSGLSATEKEKSDGTAPLIEQNLAMWEKIPENTLSNKQNLMRWRNSCNLNDKDESGKKDRTVLEEGEKGDMVNTSAQELPVSISEAPSLVRSVTPNSLASLSATDKAEMESVDQLRKYQRKLADESMEEMRNSRRNKYKAKIEKARREFIEAPANGSISDLYKTREEFEKKFKVSMEEVARPVNPARGPLLQKFNSSEFKSKIEMKDLPPAVFARMPQSKYDKEYKRIVAEAEQRWAAQNRERRKQVPLDDTLYTTRAFSTGYLESPNLDTSIDTAPSEASREPEHIQRHISGAQSAMGSHSHQSRSRTRDGEAEAIGRDAKHRARSVDFLMNEAGREEMEPPENQLKKILGEPSTENVSEHELRFRKSVEKLHVPGWYLNSEFCPGNKSNPNKSFDSVSTSYAPVFTPVTPEPREFPDASSFTENRPRTAQSNYLHLKTEESKSDDNERPNNADIETYSSEKTDATVTLWNSVNRQNALYSSDRTYQKRREQPLRTKIVSKPNANASKRDDAFLPTNFFSKYKDEIEHLRLSRSSLRLNKSEDSTERRRPSELQDPKITNVPVATIRPRTHLQEFQDRSSSSLSEPQSFPVSTSIQDRKVSPYNFQHKAPPSVTSQIHEESFAEGGMMTSTPNSSVQLQRRPPPIPPPRPSTLVPRKPPRVLPLTQDSQAPSTDWETRRHEGYSVSAVPPEWNQAGNRNSRVIEVADTFSDPRGIRTGPDGRRIAGQITLDEVLDGMLGLPHQRRLSTLDESSASLESFAPIPKVFPETPTSEFGPGIFAKDSNLMDRVAKSPERAPEILRDERLVVRCDYCGKTKELEEAKKRYVSCKHCYSYYCSRICRRSDWAVSLGTGHRDRCNFARVNTLCKEIILKVREDPEAQWQLSRVARQGNQSRGRGSVNFRFQSPFLAETFVRGGWAELSQYAGNHLYYYTVQDLVDGKKDPNLIALCRRYDPGKKLILSVSIVADIDDCPETPQSQRSHRTEEDGNAIRLAATPAPLHTAGLRSRQAPNGRISDAVNGNNANFVSEWEHRASPQQNFQRTQSLPHRSNKSRNQDPDARTVLKSVLRSMENIAPGMPPEVAAKLERDEAKERKARQDAFSRGERSRHTFGNFNTRPHFGSSMQSLSGSRPQLFSTTSPTVV